MPSRSESLQAAGAGECEPARRVRTRWGMRAAALYKDAYAERYRAQDELAGPASAAVQLAGWLRAACDRFDGPIDALDLGCGTGRYFHALAHVRRLVGIDVSPAMLIRARHPAGDVALLPGGVTLVEGDFLTHEFCAAEFDLVYSIGVLAEHSPFDETVAARVQRWLKPGGRFAFTTVHPRSSSVPRTLRRRAGEWLTSLARVAPAAARRPLRDRLMREGLYADEERVRDVLAAVNLGIESIEPFASDVHLHVLTLARKPIA
jgi:SAM-dependent methyltransferase